VQLTPKSGGLHDRFDGIEDGAVEQLTSRSDGVKKVAGVDRLQDECVEDRAAVQLTSKSEGVRQVVLVVI
jgi:hypothetical protein